MTIAHNQVRQHFRTVKGKPLEVELDETLSGTEHERDEPSAADVLRALLTSPPPNARRSSCAARGPPLRRDRTDHGAHAERAGGADLPGPRRTGRRAGGVALVRRGGGRGLAPPRRPARPARGSPAASTLRECPTLCSVRHVQRDQRKLLKGLSFIPVPASLFLLRGETAAAATGVGAAGAATGSAAGTGIAAALATGVTVKVAAVTATAAVAGGVGYGVTSARSGGQGRAQGDSPARRRRDSATARAPSRCAWRRPAASGPAPQLPRPPRLGRRPARLAPRQRSRQRRRRRPSSPTRRATPTTLTRAATVRTAARVPTRPVKPTTADGRDVPGLEPPPRHANCRPGRSIEPSLTARRRGRRGSRRMSRRPTRAARLERAARPSSPQVGPNGVAANRSNG